MAESTEETTAPSGTPGSQGLVQPKGGTVLDVMKAALKEGSKAAEKAAKRVLSGDKEGSVKAGDTSIKGQPSSYSIEYIKGIQSALVADSQHVDLTPLKLCFIRDNLDNFTNFSTTKVNPTGWKNFICLEDNDIASFVSKVFGYYDRSNSMSNFLNLSTIQKAKLYPHIALYKVDRNSKIPIIFPNDFKSTFSGNRSYDYGLKSVNFDFKNQNPFGAGRIVDVSIQMFVVNGHALVAQRGGWALTDLFLRPGQNDPEVYDHKSYELQLDLGYALPGEKYLNSALNDNRLSLILNLIEYDFQIQENGNIIVTANYKARIETTLEDKFDYNIFPSSRTTTGVKRIKELHEQITELSADINKKQQEIDNLELDIATAIEQAGEGYEPFDDNTALGQIGNFAVSEIIDGLADTVEQSGFGGSQDQETRKKRLRLEEEKTRLSNKRSALRKQMVGTTKSNKIAMYGSLLEMLGATGKIRSLVVPKTSLVIYGEEFEKILQEQIDKTITDLGITEAEDIVRATNALRENIREEVRRSGVDDGKLERVDFAQKIKEKMNDLGTDDYKQAIDKINFNELVSENLQPETGFASSASGDYNLSDPSLFSHITDLFKDEADSKKKFSEYEKIYWFYLGDLIDLAMSNNDISKKLKEDRLGFVLGPLGIDTLRGEGVRLANVADIPITMEMYQQYFVKNVVSKDLDEYFLHDFIRHAMYQLLTPSLNQKCFGEEIDTTVKIDGAVIELDNNLSGVYYSNLSGITSLGGTGNRYLMEDSRVGNTTLKQRLAKSRINAKNMLPEERWSYFIFYSNQGKTSKEWAGDETADRSRGIFHFSPGLSRGLVKELKFSKNKKPGFTTMMVERAFNESEESLKVWSIFDIELVMVGNTLLRPGMHIYIDPGSIGMGSPQTARSFSRRVGLGGYYLVTSVSNSISDGDWETRIIAKWVSSGGTGSRSTSSAATIVNSKTAGAALGEENGGKKKAKKPSKKKKNKKGTSSSGGSDFLIPTDSSDLDAFLQQTEATLQNLTAFEEEQ